MLDLRTLFCFSVPTMKLTSSTLRSHNMTAPTIPTTGVTPTERARAQTASRLMRLLGTEPTKPTIQLATPGDTVLIRGRGQPRIAEVIQVMRCHAFVCYVTPANVQFARIYAGVLSSLSTEEARERYVNARFFTPELRARELCRVRHELELHRECGFAAFIAINTKRVPIL